MITETESLFMIHHTDVPLSYYTRLLSELISTPLLHFVSDVRCLVLSGLRLRQ